MKNTYRIAHNLKNMAKLINDKVLAQAAESAEQKLGAGEISQYHMYELEKELSRVIKHIRKLVD